MLKITPIKSLQDNYIWALSIDDKLVIVDPGESAPVIQYLANNNKLKLEAIIITHFHFDHIDGIKDIIKATSNKVKVFAPEAAGAPKETNNYLRDKQEFEVAGLTFCALATPGHASEHFIYYNEKHKLLFAGDCLFPLGCGRLFTPSEKEMLASMNKIKKLSDDLKLFSGHEYTLTNLSFALTLEPNSIPLQKRASKIKQQLADVGMIMPSTLGEEKETNPFLLCDNKKWQNILNLGSELEVFTEIRKRRSSFVMPSSNN